VLNEDKTFEVTALEGVPPFITQLKFVTLLL
jgi:hypothetical protein